MGIRTDLVSEENIAEDEDIKTEETMFEGIKIETAEIKSDAAARRVNKPKGRYCTIRFGKLDSIADTAPLKRAVISALSVLTGGRTDNALIVGLGNADITPDALGPLCANSILATRHLTEELKKTLGLKELHMVSCIAPGVLGKTGIEASDIIKATVKQIKPAIVLAVDALAAKSAENLCRTIQMTDSGIAPGSGVKNERAALCESSLGVPTVAIGIPTVIDAGCFFDETFSSEKMMVTPKEIDLLVARSAEIIARALNMFFQPSLDEQTIESLS